MPSNNTRIYRTKLREYTITQCSDAMDIVYICETKKPGHGMRLTIQDFEDLNKFVSWLKDNKEKENA